MRCYISGPMTGIPFCNLPAFFVAEEVLKGLFPELEIVNPANLGEEAGMKLEWEYYLRRDLVELLGCEMLVLLDGWRNSRGSVLELVVAQALGFEIYELVGGELVERDSKGWDLNLAVEL